MFVELADRVYVARHRLWDVNVGLVLGRDGAVIVDTRASERQGADILRDLDVLGIPVPVTHVVNTHVHFDHTFGNAVFDGAQIWAHENAVRALPADAARVKESFAGDLDGCPEVGYSTADVADLLATHVMAPTHAFRTDEQPVAIDLGDRSVVLSHPGRGHTDGDITIAVPDAGVLFAGDLLEESGPPAFGIDSWPLEWPGTLTTLLGAKPPRIVVPGHGRHVGAAFVLQQRSDLEAVLAVICERHAAGMSLERASTEEDRRLPYPLEDLTRAFERAWEHLAAPPERERPAPERADTDGARQPVRPSPSSPSASVDRLNAP